ncbi:MAG: GIN domain-containing protein [Rhizomicrobium sp.]
MKRILLLSATAALFTTGAYADTTVAVGRFHSVTIEGMGHVTFVHGAQQHVVLKEGDTNNTQVYVKDGDLVFKSCPGKGMFGLNSSCPAGYNLVVEITTPDLSAVEIDGSGKIDSRGAFPRQGKLDVEINGSGNVDLMGIAAGTSSVAIHGSGKVHVNAQENLSVEIAGSGQVVYGGHPHVSQTILGSGEVKSAQ